MKAASIRKKDTPLLSDVEELQQWSTEEDPSSNTDPLPPLLQRIATGNFPFLCTQSPSPQQHQKPHPLPVQAQQESPKLAANGLAAAHELSMELTIRQPEIGRKISRSATLTTPHRQRILAEKFYSTPFPVRAAPSPKLKDDSYTVFRTKSRPLEKQASRLHPRNRPRENGGNDIASTPTVPPAGRYFDALSGPELETLKGSEEILLPRDQLWPFLLRFPIGCFGITLGLGSQTILWKTLSMTTSMLFLHIPRSINFILWVFALLALIIISITYLLKCLFYFEAVRREYYHPVRINFFFAPWIACMFLTLGVPPAISTSIHPMLWCFFMAPVFLLELKIYGQWFSGGDRRLSKVANPSTHLSLVGNFVGALLAATTGWKEPAIFFWAVGLVHSFILIVTLYQRLPTAEVLPRDLHPVFFLFVAAPSAASVAWETIVQDFDAVSRICYFVGLFLYASLVVRLNFFRGVRFSVAWWAYTFPMTASAIATIHYANEVKHPVARGLAVCLSLISSVTVSILFVLTVLHICIWHTMFPNDMAIAITLKRKKRKGKTSNAVHNGVSYETTVIFFIQNRRIFNRKVIS